MNVLVDFERQLRVPLVDSPPTVRVHSCAGGIGKREIVVAEPGACYSHIAVGGHQISECDLRLFRNAVKIAPSLRFTRHRCTHVRAMPRLVRGGHVVRGTHHDELTSPRQEAAAAVHPCVTDPDDLIRPGDARVPHHVPTELSQRVPALQDVPYAVVLHLVLTLWRHPVH